MKILFFSPYYFPYTSGISTYPQKLFKYLSEKHQIRVITFAHSKDLASFEELNDYQIIRMPFAFKISKGFISPRSLLEFYRYLKKSEVVIVNLPSIEALPLLLLATLQGKPILAIFHCLLYMPETPFTMLVSRLVNYGVKLQLQLATHIFAYTKDYYFNQGLGKFEAKTEFILPPVETASPDKLFLQTLLAKKNTQYWIGFAGRIAREKGLQYLINALVTLQSQDPQSCFCLIIAGPDGNSVVGEKSYWTMISKLLRKHQINVTFLGTLSGAKLAAFFRAIDVLVLPSINSTEAFGMVQAEAMLQGTPVIASNLPGVRVPIQQTGMGIVVPPMQSNPLAQAIHTVLHQGKMEYQKNRLKARQIFNNQKVYDCYEQYLQQLN